MVTPSAQSLQKRHSRRLSRSRVTLGGVVDHRFHRLSFIKQLGLLGCAIPFVRAQTPQARVRRIGFLIGGGIPSSIDAFREALRALGYVEGRNLHLEMRMSGAGSDLAARAAELARLDL